MKFSKQRQTGISNIQVMVGVLISAILILGGIGLIRYIDKSKVNNELSELMELKAQTVAYGSSHGGNFESFTQELAIGLGFFPLNRISGATGARVIANQWNGTITVNPTLTYIANDALYFLFTGVPASACKEIVVQALATSVVINVNGQYAKQGVVPIDDSNIIRLCDMNGDFNSIGYAMTK